jgi:excisionase family DNA binding protein
MMTIEEASGYLTFPRSTISKLVKEHQLPGRLWMFHRKGFDQWFQERPKLAE